MTTSSSLSVGRALALAGAVAFMAGSAAATTVKAFSEVSIPHLLTVYASNGDELDLDRSVAYEIGGISLSAERTTPGVSTDAGSGAATITNLLDVDIGVVFDEFFTTEASYFLDAPGLVASASAEWNIFLGDELFDRGAVAVAGGPCGPLGASCQDESIDPGAWATYVDIGAGETIAFDITGTVRAALLPVPAPASGGLLALALAALAASRLRKGSGRAEVAS